MSKVCIAGSRSFTDWLLMWEFLEKKLADFLKLTTGSGISEIVSGTAKGADKLGERYAVAKSIPIKRFPADWNKYGKVAGHVRNRQMAEYADVCVVFWDGESRGSANMIACTKELKLPTIVVKYKVRRFQIFNLGGKKGVKNGQ